MKTTEPLKDRLLARPGNYILVLYLPEAKQLVIGIRPKPPVDFPAGYYLYIGSAMGSNGIANRVARYARPDKKKHWHIDYLLDEAQLLEAWQLDTAQSYEHEIAHCLAEHFAIAAPRFGSSDCHCASHLLYSTTQPNYNRVKKILLPVIGKNCTFIRYKF